MCGIQTVGDNLYTNNKLAPLWICTVPCNGQYVSFQAPSYLYYFYNHLLMS